MLQSPTRPHASMHTSGLSDDTLVVLPETPRVRLSPRRRMQPQTPGWMTLDNTIRMYTDEESDETVNFTMNAEFIEG